MMQNTMIARQPIHLTPPGVTRCETPRPSTWLASTQLAWAAMLALATMLSFAATGAHAADAPGDLKVVLAADGRVRAVVVLHPDADDVEKQAGAELQQHLSEITGGQVEMVVRAEVGDLPLEAVAIVVGDRKATAAELALIREKKDDPASFMLDVSSSRIRLIGLSSEGVRNAAYELLEQLGVRWFHPGKLGIVVPRLTTLAVAVQNTLQGPSFAGRWQHPSDKTWQARMRMGGPFFAGSHGIPGFGGQAPARRAALAERPDTFSFNRATGQRTIAQACVSNPDTIELVAASARAYFTRFPDRDVIGMGPNDWSGHCECDGCLALDAGDFDPLNNEISKTDRYVWFFNQILDKIEDEFPDKGIAFYIYHSYIRPPVKVTPNPRIQGSVAPITLCRVHGAGNPVCPESRYYEHLVREWGKVLPKLYDRGYWFNLADAGFPFMMVHRVRQQIPLAHELGIYAWRVEVLNHWASESPSLYIAAKLMWDHQADVDALLADYFEKYYGPASKPMGTYVMMLDEALKNGDYHTGSSFDLPHFYTPELRAKARKLLDEAARLAGGETAYAERVNLTRTSFDYGDAFVEMIERRNRHDWAGSKEALDQVLALQQKLIKDWDIPMIHPRTSPSYLQRFFRQATDQGYERTVDGNRLVAPLADQWEFQIDTTAFGEDIGLFAADNRGGNWQPILTSSQSWSNQGLRYYKGEAWYRQEVKVPAEAKGQRLFLWFGGVDEQAKVWVNGQEIGHSHNGSFIPFELDATPAIRAGEMNTIVVRLSNRRLDEIGTGGITAPAFLYIPAGGEEASLRNVRQTPPMFPAY